MEFVKHVRPLTGEADWPIWKRKVRDLLDYHEGAIDCIDNKLVKPEPLSDTATEAEKKQHKAGCDLYRKANSYAKSMITSMVSDSVYQKIMDKETAHEAWTALRDQFEATSQDQLFKVCADFFAFVWTSGDDVSTHVAKLRILWNELNNGLRQKTLNTLPDLILVCKILHILPSSFDTFKSGWMLLAKDDAKTFEELSLQLTVYERNSGQQISSDNTGQEALYAKSDKQKASGNKGKQRSNKPPPPKQSRPSNECNYCHKPGHWVRQCRKWIADGRPARSGPDSASSGVQSNVADSTIALVSIHNEVLVTEQNSEDWWVDNGATKHVTSRSDWFTSFTKFQSPCSIIAAGEERLNALGSGVIEVFSVVNGRGQHLQLKDVWLVPKIAKHLFSPLAAHDKNPISKFESTVTSCTFSVNSVPVLTGVREQDGSLFKADIKVVSLKNNSSINLVESKDLLQLYHERWGHQDKRHVKEKLEHELDTKVKLEKKICQPCIYGKTHRLQFGTRRKTSKPGELISVDVCGPFNESFQKKRYLVVFKDSYTKFRYGFVIKEKSEVKTVLGQMLAHAEKQGHNVKELLSDNGGEFDNAEVRKILQEKGVTQRLTAPYTPQQNGLSERENRTIVEMARTFMHSNADVQFPKAIWAELVTTAIYILNRTGKSSEGRISPYELWFGKKPRISHLRIIGSTCYLHIPAQKRHKMDKKAQKGYLVGYDGDERYRIYIPKGRRVLLSRDVIFHEVLCDCKTVKLPVVNSPTAQEEATDEREITKPRVSEFDSDPGSISCSKEAESESNSDTEEKSENTRKLRNRDNIKPPTYYKDFVMGMTTEEEPLSYEEALQRPDSIGWKKAMDNEMDSLVENNTFKLEELPKGSKAIPCKWVFKLKLNPDSSILKYKARLVAKGYDQRRGIDFDKTFSPVAKLQTIRLMLAIASTEKMDLAQFDVSTAFLYGELEETIYMKQPDGYNDGTGRVWQLKRSLYGLKQSPRCWHKRIGKFLEDLQFKVSLEEPCLFVRERNNEKVILALYVDDGLVAATSKHELDEFLNQLRTEFKITSKDADYFLGLEIKKLTNGDIKICQKAYAQKILERFNFAECNPVSSPMVLNQGSDSGKVVGKEHNFPYRQAVGSLMYLMLGSRPDLAYAVGFLSRSLENPTVEDVMKLKRVFRYISGTLDFGIVYRQHADIGILECYSDADFGGCAKTGRSTSGVLVKYAEGAISWFSQRQASVTESTAEAEIVAASEAAKEVIWLSRLLSEITMLRQIPIVRIDNAAAVRLAENPENHRRTKHVQRKHFFIRELISDGKLAVMRVPAEDQLADGLTKPLAAPRIRVLRDKMGLI